MKYKDKEPNKYYKKKGDKGEYGKNTGYKYGQYRPGMIKDNGKPLKKNGRKKGTVLRSPSEVSLDVGKVVNLMTFGAKEITSDENKNKGIMPNKPLKIKEACDELGINITSFYYYLNKFPDIKEQYSKLKEDRREYMREISEANIEKALKGKLTTLKESEIVDYSFKMLERTDRNYNPKQIVETTVEEININRSTDDIISDIADLIK